VVIGALIIKHEKGLSDGQTVEEIRENPYLQYFLGFEEFSHTIPFDASLFVTIRKRLGEAAFENMTRAFIDRTTRIKNEQIKAKQSKKKTKGGDPPSSAKSTGNKGQLIIDATVAPADIKFPTDLDLVSGAREQSEY